MRIGLAESYLITDPALIQEVLVTKQRNFVKGKYLQNTKKVFGEGLLTSEGDLHHRQRRLVQPAFHRNRLDEYAKVITGNENRLTSNWKDGQVLDIHRQMTGLTMSIIAKCLFDRELESDSVSRDLTTTIEYFNRLSSPIASLLGKLPSNRRYEEATSRIDAFVNGLVAQRRRSPADRGDLLSTLLEARHEDGSRMPDSQIRDEVLITFAAGHETTANALTWTWYLLSENPKVEEKLHAEVNSVLPNGQTPTAGDLPKLVYVNNVMTESMRIYPPAWILSREAVEECVIGDYPIPKGADVLISQYVTHHDPRFFPDPEKFDPDRWTEEMKNALPRFAYFPFGGGARSCVGEPFAWMEGVLLLAAISSNWRMHYAGGRRVEMLPRITLRPKKGMPMKLERRE